MMYQLINQIFQFTIVGSMYLSIKMAFAKYCAQTIAYSHLFYNDTEWVDWFQSGGFENNFTIFYMSIILFVLLLSLGTDLGNTIMYFKALSVLLAFCTIFSLLSIFFFLKQTGFHPPVMECMMENEKDKCVWEDVTEDFAGAPFFSWTVLCGYGMFTVFFFPMILRPVDFIKNATSYLVGMFTYVLLLPVFTNVMSIYSFSNLQDVSWGNRPSAA